jgi:hypothetical protein
MTHAVMACRGETSLTLRITHRLPIQNQNALTTVLWRAKDKICFENKYHMTTIRRRNASGLGRRHSVSYKVSFIRTFDGLSTISNLPYVFNGQQNICMEHFSPRYTGHQSYHNLTFQQTLHINLNIISVKRTSILGLVFIITIMTLHVSAFFSHHQVCSLYNMKLKIK